MREFFDTAEPDDGSPEAPSPLDRVSRALLARAWAAGAGPGEAPFTIDLDSTVCETYGFAKEGAQRPGYTGARGYHPAARGGGRDG